MAYFSKRVEDEIFSLAAVNLALFSERKSDKEYGEICRELKIDESMNYQMYKQLDLIYRNESFQLRIENEPKINNIGMYRYQFGYKHIEFIKFDKYLFGRWKDIDDMPWGNALE